VVALGFTTYSGVFTELLTIPMELTHPGFRTLVFVTLLFSTRLWRMAEFALARLRWNFQSSVVMSTSVHCYFEQGMLLGWLAMQIASPID
jgi:hypothetical protein